MRIALIGFGVEGQVSYDYFTALGHGVIICDQDPTTPVPAGVMSQLGENYLDSLGQYDLIVRSAGINPDLILQKNIGVESKMTTAVNEFFARSPTKNIIGVTGTKGKGTTSTLITKMLEAAGKRVFLGGNIGRSPLEFIHELNVKDWVVLELSSFQLCDIKHSPPIAVCLMVVPEHLNWHAGIDEYLMAKLQMFTYQTPDDIAIYCAKNSDSWFAASGGLGQKVPYYSAPGAFVNDLGQIVIGDSVICNTSDLKLLGQHNWQNVCAAITAVWQVMQNVEAIRAVATTFTGLEHRLEFVKDVGGVQYYDDSFGTTPETAQVAIEAFSAPKVVILGGSDKGATYKSLAKAIKKNNVRAVIAIGETGTAISEALQNVGYKAIVGGGSTMEEIIKNARAAAQPGDVVLLSTACASFDLFKDYKDRGDQFKTIVSQLS